MWCCRTVNWSSWEAEAGGLLHVQGQLGLYNEFWDSQDHIETLSSKHTGKQIRRRNSQPRAGGCGHSTPEAGTVAGFDFSNIPLSVFPPPVSGFAACSFSSYIFARSVPSSSDLFLRLT